MRMYTVSFENVSIPATNAMDLFEITPADDKPVKLCALYLSNVGGTADAGDAQEELLRLVIKRGFTTSGSGGSTPTAVPVNSSTDTAAGFTAEANNTTVATTGTTTDIHADGWNVRVPYQVIWPPEMRPGASQANTTIIVRLVAGPADAVLCSGTIYVAEDC